MKTDMTQGKPVKVLLGFTIPVFIGNVFQQFYNMVDAVVVGKFVGTKALAAVGSTGTIIFLIIGFLLGLTAGFTVLTAQKYGAGKMDEMRQTVGNALILTALISAVMTAVSMTGMHALLKFMHTPDDIFKDAYAYVMIICGGIFAQALYNILASILRALGNSKVPLYFLILSAMLNIVLDLVFVVVFRMSVQGVGIATILSQFISAVLITFCLMRTNECYRLKWSKVRFHKMLLIRIIQIGVPAGLQSVMYNIANIIIQSNVNLLGSNTMAAYTAYSKIDAVFWMIMNAFGVSVSTFAGQNFGAGKLDRVRKSMKICLCMALGASIGLSVILHFFGRYVYMLFTTDAQVIEIGMQILYFLTPIYFTYVTIEVVSGTVRSMGFVFTPMLMTCGGVCVLRLLWLFIAVPQNRTITNILFSYPLSWVVTSILFIIYYIYLNKTGKIEAAREHSLV